MTALIRKLILITLISTALCGCAWLAFAGSPARLYVVNALSEDISVIDTASDAVVSTIKLGAQGFNLAFSPKRDLAYITAPSTVIVLDVKKARVLSRFAAPISPLATIHVSPDGKRAYVVTAAEPGKRNEERGRVLCIDLQEKPRVRKSIEVGLNPLSSAMTPDGKKLYTADWGSRSISVIDLAHERLADTIPLGASPARVLAMRPDGTKVYAAQEAVPMTMPISVNNGNANAQPYNNMAQTTGMFQMLTSFLWIIDTATGKSEKIALDNFTQVYALAVAPNGSKLYAYGRIPVAYTAVEQSAHNQQQALRLLADGYSLVEVDLKAKTITRRLGDFGFLSGIHFSANGGKIYLTGTPGNAQAEATVQTKNIDNITAVQNAAPGRSDQTATKGIIQDLSRLPKTVTVLDANTGKALKTLTIGSLPQGGALWVEEAWTK